MVVGSLGDVVKKQIELDLHVVEERYKASAAYFGSMSLHKLIQEWPVIDEHKAFMLSKCMQISMQKFKATEKEIETTLLKVPNYTMLQMAVSELFKYRDEIRFAIAELNKLSGGVGKASSIPADADLVIAKIGE